MTESISGRAASAEGRTDRRSVYRARRGTRAGLRELYRYRELLLMVAYRDIRVKYKQTVMGFLWAVFMPAIVVGAGILVKYAFAATSGKPVEPASLAAVAVKSVPWAFFVASIRFSSNSLIANTNLVTKIAFPKEIFPIAAVLSQLFDFLIASAVLGVALAFSGIGVGLSIAWVPLLLAILVLFVLGLGTLLAVAGLFFRDVKYIVEVVLTFAIFVTPVFYEAESFGRAGRLLLLNPVAPVLEGLRAAVVLHRNPDLAWTSWSAAAAVIVAVGGYSLFKKLETSFAESI
jgi:ABC-type polysaccharide/polyol phosphate export permease